MILSSEIKIGALIMIAFIVVVVLSPIKWTSTPLKQNETNLNSFSKSSIAKHNIEKDCWLIINDNVYNATDYLIKHPGGAETIIPYCGYDATEAYNKVKKHDAKADADLANLFIGTFQK